MKKPLPYLLWHREYRFLFVQLWKPQKPQQCGKRIVLGLQERKKKKKLLKASPAIRSPHKIYRLQPANCPQPHSTGLLTSQRVKTY
jgi:hypothetical protein